MGLSPTPTIDAEIEGANDDACAGDDPTGKIGIDDGVEVMEQKAALVEVQTDPGFKITFGESERTGPWARLHCDSPKQGQDVQRSPDGPAARP